MSGYAALIDAVSGLREKPDSLARATRLSTCRASRSMNSSSSRSMRYADDALATMRRTSGTRGETGRPPASACAVSVVRVAARVSSSRVRWARSAGPMEVPKCSVTRRASNSASGPWAASSTDAIGAPDPVGSPGSSSGWFVATRSRAIAVCSSTSFSPYSFGA